MTAVKITYPTINDCAERFIRFKVFGGEPLNDIQIDTIRMTHSASEGFRKRFAPHIEAFRELLASRPSRPYAPTKPDQMRAA